jgi:tetratricopeptide (TPR) repeat protein
MNQPHVYYSQLYRNFRNIESGEYRKVVYFYERHEKEILRLDFEEYFELLVAYTQALFETETHQKHLLMADVVIEIAFAENITHLGGQEIFKQTLFQKSVSYYHLLDYKKAIHVLSELIKIDPNYQDATDFMARCLRKSRSKFVRNTRAVAIFTFLATALIISIEVLFIRNFAVDWVSLVEWTRNISFGLGIFILIGGELVHWLRARREVFKLVNSVKKVKNKVKY